MTRWLLPLALLAAPAWARCPTAADLAAGGVVATYDDGREEVFRAGDRPGVVVLERADPDGTRARMELAQGVFLVSWQNPDHARVVASGYGAAPDDLPAPAPGGRWDGAVDDGDPGSLLRQAQAFGEVEALTIGGCTFDALQALIVDYSFEYAPDPTLVTTRSLYLPALGIALEVHQQIADAPPADRAPVAIEAAP